MKVLLTGANGFVGSQILEALRANHIGTRLFLRPGCNTRLILPYLNQVEVQSGTLTDPAALRQVLAGVTHVIHCAGATRALRSADFYTANQQGTKRLVTAINDAGVQIQRLVHVSSFAAVGPALPARPAREDDPPRPVSEYGRSKLAGEQEVKDRCRAEFVILRPPAVYGPGDTAFLKLFQAIQGHVAPHFGGGHKAISLAFVQDLARIVVNCLTHPAVVGKIYHVASQEVVTIGELTRQIAAGMNVWTIRLPLPAVALAPLCLAGDLVARLTKRPGTLSRDKYEELRAPGWVGDTSRIRADLGGLAMTPLAAGIAETIAWYRRQGWLR
jgi:nucleoside-diphosphate-sugar epimerase